MRPNGVARGSGSAFRGRGRGGYRDRGGRGRGTGLSRGFNPGFSFTGSAPLEPTVPSDKAADNLQSNNHIADASDAVDDPPRGTPQIGKTSLKRKASPSVPAGEPAKRTRVSGGKAPVPKRIDPDEIDSDDQRIITLKQQGYSDDHVAKKLIEEGRIRYVPKTINSRWLRLRKAADKKEDDRLDDELSDWHIGEDAKLNESYKAIERKFEREIAKVMEKKWKEVSDNLADRLKQKKKYTGKACKERFEALQNGTNLPPIELDQDPEGRTAMREERIATAKARRAELIAEAKRAERDKEQARLDKREAKRQKQRDKNTEKEARAAEKAEVARIKAEKKEGKEKERRARKKRQTELREAAEEKATEGKLENIIFQELTGKTLSGRRRTTKVDDDVENDADADDEDDEEDEEPELDDDDEIEMTDLTDAEEDGATTSDDEGSDVVVKCGNTKTKKTVTAIKAVKVTKETLLNPRSVLKDGEIDVLLYERGLARRGSRESHPYVIARLAAHDEALSTTDLNNLLEKHFDKGKGNRAAKILRLQEYDAVASSAGSNGVKATDLQFKTGYAGYTGTFKGLIGGEEGGEE